MNRSHLYIRAYGKATRFKPGEQRTVEAGRKGGIRSGQVRRLRAERRKHADRMIADLVYHEYLVGVTEEELRDFIRWRGQRKRKKTILAKAALDDSEETDQDRQDVQDFLEVWRTMRLPSRPKKNFWEGVYYINFHQAVADDRPYWKLMEVFDAVIKDIIWCMERLYVLSGE